MRPNKGGFLSSTSETHQAGLYPKEDDMSDKETELRNAVEVAEEALGNNLTWLADALDLRIRQGDSEVTARLEQLNNAWVALAKAKHE